MTDDAAEGKINLFMEHIWFFLGFFPVLLLHQTPNPVNGGFPQQLIHEPMLIYAPKHKSHSLVHYFSNPPCHSIDVFGTALAPTSVTSNPLV